MRKAQPRLGGGRRGGRLRWGRPGDKTRHGGGPTSPPPPNRGAPRPCSCSPTPTWPPGAPAGAWPLHAPNGPPRCWSCVPRSPRLREMLPTPREFGCCGAACPPSCCPGPQDSSPRSSGAVRSPPGGWQPCRDDTGHGSLGRGLGGPVKRPRPAPPGPAGRLFPCLFPTPAAIAILARCGGWTCNPGPPRQPLRD